MYVHNSFGWTKANRSSVSTQAFRKCYVKLVFQIMVVDCACLVHSQAYQLIRRSRISLYLYNYMWYLKMFIYFTNESCTAAIKQRMEKDVDEVGKVARFVKTKVEELDREVSPFAASTWYCMFLMNNILSYLLSSNF